MGRVFFPNRHPCGVRLSWGSGVGKGETAFARDRSFSFSNSSRNRSAGTHRFFAGRARLRRRPAAQRAATQIRVPFRIRFHPFAGRVNLVQRIASASAGSTAQRSEAQGAAQITAGVRAGSRAAVKGGGRSENAQPRTGWVTELEASQRPFATDRRFPQSSKRRVRIHAPRFRRDSQPRSALSHAGAGGSKTIVSCEP